MAFAVHDNLAAAVSKPTAGRQIDNTISATLRQRLNGEASLSFTVIIRTRHNYAVKPPAVIVTPGQVYISLGMCVEYDGQYYNVVRVRRSIAEELYTADIECEHCSYILNNEEYTLTDWSFIGTPATGLAGLLAGTPLSVGVVEKTAGVLLSAISGKTSRRAAMMYLIAECGGEIEYSGTKINIRNHRGKTTSTELMDGQKVTDLTVTYDTSNDTEAYEIAAFKRGTLTLGDEVHIDFMPLDINRTTRIIGLEYNPFFQYDVKIEVGAYVPELLAASNSALKNAKYLIEEWALSKLTFTQNEFSVALEAGRAEVMSYADGLNAENRTWTSSQLQLTASSFSVTIDALQTYMDGSINSLSSAISQSATQILSTVSATYATQTALSGEATARANGDTATLVSANSAISQSATQILSTVSATYATQTALSSVSQQADKISWLVQSGTSSGNFTLTDRVATLVAANINLTGFVTFSNLSTSGQSTINGDNITSSIYYGKKYYNSDGSAYITCEYSGNESSFMFYSTKGNFNSEAFKVRTSAATANMYLGTANFLRFDPATYGTGTVAAVGTWVFSNATVTGLTATAVFA